MDNNIIETSASSPEIAKINRELIESVKFDFVKDIIKSKSKDDDAKTILTIDDLFENVTEKGKKKNPFYQDEKELLEDLIGITNTKHYQQLRFLSINHLNKIIKLRFILKPFSYFFVLGGNDHYHVIWETLDTQEATYIWHVEKKIESLKSQIQQIEGIIKLIKLKNKREYINNADSNFQRIFHDYSDINGFDKWRNEIEDILT